MSWFSGYDKRLKLTIDDTNIDDTLSDFPILLNISASSGIGSTDLTPVFDELTQDSNRKKIAVTTSDGETQCYVEIERWNDANEKAVLRVKAPSVASGAETILYLYYDSSQPDNTTYVGDTGDTPAQSVWDSNFKAVYHMAQIGKGIDFDGSNDYINCANALGALLDTVYTVECVAKTDVINENNIFLGYRSSTDSNPILFQLDHNNADVRMFVGDDAGNIATASKGSVLTITDHFYIVGVRNGSDVDIYVDASIGTADTDTFGAITENQFNIGAINPGAAVDLPTVFNGIIDEIRISNIDRSAAWIKATYYSNWDALVSFGIEEIEVSYCVSGYVKENIIPINRQIYLHNRDTGALVTSTTSSGGDGYFYMETTYSGAHYVVCLDDLAGENYNDLIYGNIYPTTISG
jgi:hypothetical protein